MTDPTWPTNITTGIITRATTMYDGDAATPHTVGRLWYATTFNGDFIDGGLTNKADIINTYTYQSTGEVLTSTQEAYFDGSPTPNEMGSMAYTYTVNGRLLTTTDNITGVESQYIVNKLGQSSYIIATTSGDKSVQSSYAYDQEGAVAQTILKKPNGDTLTTRTFDYLPNGWLDTTDDDFTEQQLQYTTGNCTTPPTGYYNGALAHNTVTYPGVTTPTPPPSDYCYTIDHLNRIIVAQNTGGSSYSWGLDNNSNFKTYTLDSEVRTYTTAANKNQLTAITSTVSANNKVFTYNAVGDMDTMTDGTNSLLTFDYNNWNMKARSIARPQDNIESVFDYGPDDSRIRKRINVLGVLAQTYYHMGDVEKITTVSTSSTQTKRYLEGGLIYVLEEDKFYWAFGDNEGSTRMIVDEVGNPQYIYNYDVYGAPTIIGIGTPTILYNNLYTGQYYDGELELYNYHARFYDPTIARFLQVDPAHQGFSPYVYVGDMPDIATDPSGMFLQFGLAGFSLLLGGIFTGISQISGIKGSAAGEGLFTAGLSLILVGTIMAAGTAGTAGAGFASLSVGGAMAAFAGPIFAAGLSMGTSAAVSAAHHQPINVNSLLVSGIISAATVPLGGAVSKLGLQALTRGGILAGSEGDIALTTLIETYGQGAVGAISGVGGQVAQNALAGDNLDEGLGNAALMGFIGGAAGGFLTSARCARGAYTIRKNLTMAENEAEKRLVRFGLTKREVIAFRNGEYTTLAGDLPALRGVGMGRVTRHLTAAQNAHEFRTRSLGLANGFQFSGDKVQGIRTWSGITRTTNLRRAWDFFTMKSSVISRYSRNEIPAPTSANFYIFNPVMLGLRGLGFIPPIIK